MPRAMICWRSSYVSPTNSEPLPPGHKPCTPESTSRWTWFRVAGTSRPSYDVTVTVGENTPLITARSSLHQVRRSLVLVRWGLGDGQWPAPSSSPLSICQLEPWNHSRVDDILLQRPAPAQD